MFNSLSRSLIESSINVIVTLPQMSQTLRELLDICKFVVQYFYLTCQTDDDVDVWLFLSLWRLPSRTPTVPWGDIILYKHHKISYRYDVAHSPVSVTLYLSICGTLEATTKNDYHYTNLQGGKNVPQGHQIDLVSSCSSIVF